MLDMQTPKSMLCLHANTEKPCGNDDPFDMFDVMMDAEIWLQKGQGTEEQRSKG